MCRNELALGNRGSVVEVKEFEERLGGVCRDGTVEVEICGGGGVAVVFRRKRRDPVE